MWRGTLRTRSSTARFEMPCSRRRCTSRSRVRAEVMPIPANRTSAIDAFQPALHGRQCGVSGQVDLQRRHGNIALCDGVEVRPWTGVLLRSSWADPVYGAASRILRPDDGFGSVAVTESGRAKATKLLERHVRDVDVEDMRPLQRLTQELRDETASHLGAGFEVTAAPGRRTERDGKRRQAEKAALDGGRNRARIQYVVAEIRPVVDAGNHHVVFVVKETGDGEMDAISRGPGNIVHTGLRLEDAQRHVERERVARTAAIAVGGYYGHRHIGERGEGVSQTADAFCAEAVIVADQYLHGWMF